MKRNDINNKELEKVIIKRSIKILKAYKKLGLIADWHLDRKTGSLDLYCINEETRENFWNEVTLMKRNLASELGLI